jgi:hypothetical protein
MENLEIRSAHSLISSMTGSREVGAHSYLINCNQFNSEYRSWQKNKFAQAHALGVMTKEFQRIWIIGEEIEQVAAAIHSQQSPIELA